MVMCTVTGNLKSILGAGLDTNISVQLSQNTTKYTDGTNQTIISGSTKNIVVSGGVFEVALQDTINMESDVYYIFNINNILFKRYVPDQAAEDFWSLLEVE